MSEGWTRVGSTIYRGVLMSEGWTRVGSTIYKGGLMLEVWTRVRLYCIQRWPHVRGLD